MRKQWKQTDFIFLGSKITADGDCSHEIKMLTPWKESYDQPRVGHDWVTELNLFALKWWDWMTWSSFFECWDLSQIFHSPLLPHQSESEVAQSCPTLWDPMDYSTPGFPVHHQLLEFTQIHVHWVGDAIQPSHPLSSPSPPALNLSQHQGLFQWVSSSHQVAKVSEFQLQHQSFQQIFRTDPL